jgi:hypothetical protein
VLVDGRSSLHHRPSLGRLSLERTHTNCTRGCTLKLSGP